MKKEKFNNESRIDKEICGEIRILAQIHNVTGIPIEEPKHGWWIFVAILAAIFYLLGYCGYAAYLENKKGLEFYRDKIKASQR